MRLHTLLLIPALTMAASAPAFAQDSTKADRMAHAYELGQSWANGGIPARCLIEITSEKDQPTLRTERGREGAAMRAQMIAGVRGDNVRIADAFYPLYKQQEAEQLDLLNNGLITQSEFDATAGRTKAEYEEMVQEVADQMQSAPACDFYRRHQNSPTVRRAKALLAAR